MQASGVLLGQIDSLVARMDWALQTLDALRLDDDKRAEIKVSIDSLFEASRATLAGLRKEVSRQQDLAGYWKRFQAEKQQCEDLFRECLGLLAGTLLRGEQQSDGESWREIDGEVCRIADALLREIGGATRYPWAQFTVLAEQNYFTATTGVIRLPYPDFSVWGLPVAAHELGHFLGPRLEKGEQRPFVDYLDRKQDESLQQVDESRLTEEQRRQLAEQFRRQRDHMHEFFSDLVAVYTVGPAYPCACILHRFSPADQTACRDGQRHPSHARRVHFMLRALEELDKTTDRNYGDLIDDLRALWQQNLAAAEQRDCLKDAGRLTAMLIELYPLTTKYLPKARYESWARADRIANQLGTDDFRLLTGQERIADVLNGAWYWRVKQKQVAADEVGQVGRQAVELCRQIMRRKK